jgi:hypothetical protein
MTHYVLHVFRIITFWFSQNLTAHSSDFNHFSYFCNYVPKALKKLLATRVDVQHTLKETLNYGTQTVNLSSILPPPTACKIFQINFLPLQLNRLGHCAHA